MAGLREILIIAYAAVFVEQTIAYKKCSDVSWGKRNDMVDVKYTELDTGDLNAMVNVYGKAMGCNVVGIEVIACDWFEKPIMTFTEKSRVLVTRDYAVGPGSVVAISFCEPVIWQHKVSGMPAHKLNMRKREADIPTVKEKQHHDVPLVTKSKSHNDAITNKKETSNHDAITNKKETSNHDAITNKKEMPHHDVIADKKEKPLNDEKLVESKA